jgi:hypothetical protein
MVQCTEPQFGITARNNGSAEGDRFVATFAAMVRDSEHDEAAWIAALRAKGVKAAHPDDGWVDRDEQRLHFCYPTFFEEPQPGDLVALGNHREFRLVRVTSIDDLWASMPYYHFGAA